MKFMISPLPPHALIRQRLLTSTLLALSIATSLPRLQAQILVANYYSANVSEYTLAGSAINASLLTLNFYPMQMFGDGSGDFYLIHQFPDAVTKYAPSGAVLNPSLISGLVAPQLATTDGNGHIFLYDSGADHMGRIGEYTTSGDVVNASLIPNAGDVRAMAVDGNGHLFVANNGVNGSISIYSTSGQLLTPKIITGLNIPVGLTLDGSGYLYVSCGGSGIVGKYTLSGDVVNSSLITLPNAGTITYDGNGHLLLATFTQTQSDTIREYTTSGTRVPNFLISNLSGPDSIVIVPEPSPLFLLLLPFGALYVLRGHNGWNRRKPKNALGDTTGALLVAP